MNEFSYCLRRGRIDKKLTQPELAALISDNASLVEAGTIARLESGVFVFLDRARIDRIARIIDTDSQMLWSMYTAEFRAELREVRRGRKAAEYSGNVNSSGAGKTSGSAGGTTGNGNADMSVKAPAPVKDTFLLVELEYINRAIMNLPDKTRDAVVPLIKMLVSSYSASA